jgi:hypothetical protein
MSATLADTQVRTYLEAVNAELDDLPEDDRDELLEDLEEHLLEVAAEDDGTLEQRLGPPSSYAEELRASAGLPSRNQTLARRPGQRFADRLTRSRVWAAGARLAESSQVRSLHAFLKECAPGWWVLRGYLFVLALAQITGGPQRDDFPLPFGGWGLVLIVGSVLFSVSLGRRTEGGRKARLLSIALSIAVAVIATGAAAGWDTGAYAYYEDPNQSNYPGMLTHADQAPIANICPYATDGKLLSGVLLFDQDGRPIVNTVFPFLPDGRQLERPGPAILNAYPQQLNLVEGMFEVPDSTTGQSHVEKQLRPLTCPPSIAPVVRPPASPGAGAVPSPSATR